MLGHKFSIYLRFCQKGGRIIEEGDKAKTVELMNPGVLYPEEMSQTKGSLRVRKQTQPNLWGKKKKEKESPLEIMLWGHALPACQGETHVL